MNNLLHVSGLILVLTMASACSDKERVIAQHTENDQVPAKAAPPETTPPVRQSRDKKKETQIPAKKWRVDQEGGDGSESFIFKPDPRFFPTADKPKKE